MFNRRRVVLIVGDSIALLLSFVGMVLIRFDTATQGAYIAHQAKFFGVLFILWLIIFYIFDLYNLRRVNPNPQNIGLLVAAVATASLITVLSFYIYPQSGISPKTNLAIIGAISFVLLVLWRRLFYYLFTSHYATGVAFVGEHALFETLSNELAHHPQLGTVIGSWKTIGHIEASSADLIVAESVPPALLIEAARTHNVDVLSLSKAFETLFGKIPLELMTDEKAVNIVSREKNPFSIFNRLAEMVIATILLVITSPILLLATLAILIEDGQPIIFRQTRVGRNGKPFLLYKFRSMHALAPDGSAEIAGAEWASGHDLRITRVGKILRKTHIDEILQMWNILKGDLALVGPRPERPQYVVALEREVPYYYLRHTQKPGFTGWAQIKFRYARSVLDSKEKFEYDLYYLANKNPLLDFGIILKTLQIIFTH